MVTNVYGPQNPNDKLKLLTSLEELRQRHPPIPWILGGDFNMIKSLTEKKEALDLWARILFPFRTSSSC